MAPTTPLAPPKNARRVVVRDEENGSHKEGSQRLLKGGNRTGGVGKGGPEMGQDLGLRSVFCRQLGRRTPPEECRANLALAVAESFPDALQGPLAQVAVEGANGSNDGAGDGALEEAPQAAGGQAEPADVVGAPDAEGPSAAGPCLAVAAKDTSSAHGFVLGAAFVKAVQEAVPNESADHLAVRTGSQLEPLGKGVPFLDAAVKPFLLSHTDRASAKSLILPAWRREGQRRGRSGVRWRTVERGAG